MKYILMMNTPKHGYEEYQRWPKELLRANIEFMIAFAAKLRASGELVSTVGLVSPAEAKLVRAGKDGKPITDGVFPESKEYLAGYWIVDVESAERAYELAAEASTAPGYSIRGKDHLEIEVREVMDGRPKDLGV
jgi:hypothetical protein